MVIPTAASGMVNAYTNPLRKFAKADATTTHDHHQNSDERTGNDGQCLEYDVPSAAFKPMSLW